MVKQQINDLKKLIGHLAICLIVSFTPFFLSAQLVDETIQIDTITETIEVIYKPSISTTYYIKKVAVFANDTSQIAVEKSYNKFGQNGLYKVYYPNGRLKIKTVFANDKINGEWTYYDLKGIIIIKGVYKNGVKHGYWAYKSLKIYGRYRKGLMHKKWKRFDTNDKKYLSHYKRGKLTGGEGYGKQVPVINYKKVTPKKDTILYEGNEFTFYKEYEQAISFLTHNIVLRKALKSHFSKGNLKLIRKIKKQYDNNKFQFSVAPTTYFLDDSLFYAYMIDGKLAVPVIDSTLRNSSTKTSISSHSNQVQSEGKLYAYPFENYSTDKESPITIKLGEIKNGLLRIDVVWNNENQEKTFQVLLYFDNAKVLKGAEYEKD